MTDDGTGIGVPQTVVGSVDTGHDLADELSVGSGSQVQRCVGIPQHVDAVRNLDLALQFADDAGHAGGGDGLDLGQIGQAELIGEHDGIDAAFLQSQELLAGHVNDVLHATLLIEVGVTGQCADVAHCNDRLVGSECFLNPFHVIRPPDVK